MKCFLYQKLRQIGKKFRNCRMKVNSKIKKSGVIKQLLMPLDIHYFHPESRKIQLCFSSTRLIVMSLFLDRTTYPRLANILVENAWDPCSLGTCTILCQPPVRLWYAGTMICGHCTIEICVDSALSHCDELKEWSACLLAPMRPGTRIKFNSSIIIKCPDWR